MSYSHFTNLEIKRQFGVGQEFVVLNQSTNLYAYVQNNPIDLVDPTGLCVFRLILDKSDLIKKSPKQLPHHLQMMRF